MADVDLTVGVSSFGVPDAIRNINSLRTAGLETGSALGGLSTAASTAMSSITRASAASTTATQKMSGYGNAMRQASQATSVLNKELAVQEKLYRAQSRVDPNNTAEGRLTRLGGSGGLQAGLAIAAAAAARDAAKSATMQGDAAAYAAQQENLRARAMQRVVAAAQLQGSALSNTRAREDLQAERDGQTAVQRSTTALTRAKQDLATANKAVASSNILLRNANGTFIARETGQINAQTAARNAQTAAIRQLTQAEQQLRNAQQTAKDDDGNAFQSSYSYFIIAGLATGAAVALLGMGQAAITATSQIERSFVDVERTTEGTTAQLRELRETLTGLSTTTPNSMVDLSQIAAMGNQLGIAAEDVEEFTTVIAQYSTISNVSAEEAATAFGKIGNLTGIAASEYSNLASAITYVARTSAASESTIQNTAKEITALAAGSGFSAAAIVGLGGALSSLAIPPERARGALSLYFGALNSAVAEGGPKLDAFATVTGKTVEQIDALVRAGQGQEVFTAFISGLGELDTVAKTTALDELGLSTIRVDQTMRALAQNVPLLTKSLDGAETAYAENVEMSNQYAKVQAALATKIAQAQNAAQNAAAAVGNALEPALKKALAAATSLLVEFEKFANSPYGTTMLKIAGLIGVVVGVMAGLIGALALGKASLVVFAFAMKGMGWTTASAGFRAVVAGLFATDVATRKAAISLTGLRVAMAETAIGAGVLRFAMIGLTLAVGGVVIAAFIAAMTALDQSVNATKYGMEGLGASAEELMAAMKLDNPTLFSDAVSETGEKSEAASGGVKTLSQAVSAGVKAQADASNAVQATNDAIDGQTVKLGDATQEWIKTAVLQSKAMRDILESAEQSKALGKMIEAGFDIGKFAELAYTEGADAANAYQKGWAAGLPAPDPEDPFAVDASVANRLINLNPLSQGIEGQKTAALVAAAVGDVAEASVEGTAAVDGLGKAMYNASGEAIVLSDGTDGARNSLEQYQAAISSGLGDFVDFKNVLEGVTAAQDKANEREEGPAGTDISLINANVFGEQLDAANDKAETFFTGITDLAGKGASSFATQLAPLGPDAQAILASATELGPAGLQKLEAGARLAAFFASEAFSKALNEQMANTDDAYATIFKVDGLAGVESYIAAQVAGVGAEWEQQWLANNPTLPLNVDIKDPSPEEIAAIQGRLSGRITTEAKIVTTLVGPNGIPVDEVFNVFTDKITGNTITLPTTLDGAGLTAALGIWDANQDASPAEISSLLNTAGLSPGLDAWRSINGNVNVKATFVAANTIASIVSPFITIPVYLRKVTPDDERAKGGIITKKYATGGQIKDGLPAFASGGSWGQFKGPGTGTSDSILARVSAGEYINTAKSTSFWGPDFFDSLNRNMLPTSFLNMLGAAAGSNNGPSSVTNVNVNQINPLTRDPLKQLREDSEMVASGIWG